MPEISRILPTVSTKLNSSTKQKNISTNSLKFEHDKLELSTKEKYKKNAVLITASTGLTLSSLSLGIMIGRNPAKMAKVLHGNSTFINKAYEKGNKIADDILNKTGDYKINLPTVLKIFEKPTYKTGLHADIAETESILAKNKIAQDKNTIRAFKLLKQTLNRHCNTVEQELLKGNKVNEKKRQELFSRVSKPYLSTINNFLENNLTNSKDLQMKFKPSNAAMRSQLKSYISECPQNALPTNGIFYHGTKKANKVYATGFNSYTSNQLSREQRELGAGVYVTPDVRVAAHFSGLNGDIIPIKLTKDSKIALVTEQSHRDLHRRLLPFSNERYPLKEFKKLPVEIQNATKECLIQKVFQKAGYDAAYLPKGVKSDGGLSNLFNTDMNQVIGAKQRQVVIFTPEKLEIAPRTFKERVSDLKEKFDSFVYRFHNSHA